MDLVVDIDAVLPLKATEGRCEVEQAGTYQLAEIKIGTKIENGVVLPVNKAGFNEKLSGLLANLSLDPGAIASKPGWDKLFECDMYDSSHVKHVSVFGK